MSDSDEPETKRQKLQTTRASQLNAESRMCFVRHFAKCYKKKSIPIELEKRENLLKVTVRIWKKPLLNVDFSCSANPQFMLSDLC